MALDKSKPVKIAARKQVRRRPAQPAKPKTEVHVPKFVFTFFEYTAYGINAVMSFGSWARQRAGYLALAAGAFLITHWSWIGYEMAKPRLLAQCADNQYIEAVALGRGCASEEFCTEREVAHHITLDLAFTYGASHCDQPAPFSVHGTVYKAGLSLYNMIKPEMTLEAPPVPTDPNPDEELMASTDA